MLIIQFYTISQLRHSYAKGLFSSCVKDTQTTTDDTPATKDKREGWYDELDFLSGVSGIMLMKYCISTTLNPLGQYCIKYCITPRKVFH